MALVHVLVFFLFVISIRPFSERVKQVPETILYLSSLGIRDAPPVHMIAPDVPVARPPLYLQAPLPIVKPPPLVDDKKTAPVTPGDVLGAVGRELACSAGSWEHLTGPERARCGGQPWRAMRLPNGTLVMVPPSQLPRLKEAPQQAFDVNSGADRQQRDIMTGIIPGQGGCPILQQMPCTHVTPGWNSNTGNN